ncbi:DUF922 domain-containing protein [Salinimicrobium xinjiangense]|uniref:DUF922 domain-containing protein n=1 Tax=Salinimicrobium xinjiangense TaxID=438596 RepID=UPI00048DE8DC|nr:DUF922 domain-containing protein [Salinimicrobium xinjiangense]
MKKTFLNTFLLLLLTFTMQAQLPENRLDWRAEPLSWDDFVGPPDLSSPFHANTSSGISYYWSMKSSSEGAEFLYEVGSYFLPDQSWVRPGKKSEDLLAHEQLHFDITELHARKLRKAMEEFDFEKTKNVKPALQAIYKSTEAERANMQKRFDAETRHSMNKAAQLKWQKYVQEELLKLKEFSSKEQRLRS